MKNISLILIVLAALSCFYAQGKAENFSSGYIDVDNGKLYYEAAGSGENIVLIHDGLVHSVIWDNQFDMFSKYFRVIRYDRRGYGKSSIPAARYSNVQDLDQLFTKLKIEKAVLFGMSAGGGLALDFTLKYPERVNALVLAGAVVSGYGYTSHMASRGGRIKDISAFLANTKRFIHYFGWDDPYEVYQGNLKAKEKLLNYLENNPQNVENQRLGFEAGSGRPALKSLADISAPTLVLVGEYDIPDVHAHAGAISAGIPGARREVIMNAAHLIPLEQPENFNNSTLVFLKNAFFFRLIKGNKIAAAVEYYDKNKSTGNTEPFFREAEINNLGYEYLLQDKINEAIELFKLNTAAFPNSSNAFDSLGEAYLKAGNKKLAKENYEISLKLNPENTNASEVLKKLR